MDGCGGRAVHDRVVVEGVHRGLGPPSAGLVSGPWPSLQCLGVVQEEAGGVPVVEEVANVDEIQYPRRARNADQPCRRCPWIRPWRAIGGCLQRISHRPALVLPLAPTCVVQGGVALLIVVGGLGIL